MLAGFRLLITEVGGTESDQPPESILTQDPPAGQSVAIGSPVRVTVATPRTVTVPHVVRMARNGAAAALAALKL
jgi:beta-lactam-binding protein with PASTA domain